MSTYHSGRDYIWSYSGVLKMAEGVLEAVLIIFSALLGSSVEARLLMGICIYALTSVFFLTLCHIREIPRRIDFPWFWVECIHSWMLVILFLASATFAVIVLTRGYIITGIIGYMAVMAYVLDTIDKFQLARSPRARYVWTTPNMPELA